MALTQGGMSDAEFEKYIREKYGKIDVNSQNTPFLLNQLMADSGGVGESSNGQYGSGIYEAAFTPEGGNTRWMGRYGPDGTLQSVSKDPWHNNMDSWMSKLGRAGTMATIAAGSVGLAGGAAGIIPETFGTGLGAGVGGSGVAGGSGITAGAGGVTGLTPGVAGMGLNTAGAAFGPTFTAETLLTPSMATAIGSATGLGSQGLQGIKTVGEFAAKYPGLIGAAVGALSALTGPDEMTQTQTRTMDPAMQPYVTGPGGVMPTAQNLYGQTSQVPAAGQQALNNSTQLINDMNGMLRGGLGTAGSLVGGANNATLQNPNTITAQTVNPQQANMLGQFAELGSANPLAALTQSLSGTPNDQYIDQAANLSYNRAKTGYEQLLQDNIDTLLQSVLPSIRAGAQASGGYGGTRQGLAEGQAIGKLATQADRSAQGIAQSALDTRAAMYNAAMENALQRQTNTGNNLASLLGGLETADMNRLLSGGIANQGANLSAQTSNAANQLTMNNQRIANSAQNLQNYLGGASIMNTLGNLGMQQGNQALANSVMPGQYQWSQLGNYQNAVQPFALGTMGVQSTQPLYQNPLTAGLGGYFMGTQLGKLPA